MAQKEKHIAKAQKYILKGSIDKAVAEYRTALDLDPKDISIRLRLGDLFVKSGMKSEAIEEYAEAAKANGQRGFYLKAIAVYKQVLKLDDSLLDIHKKLADLYTKQRLHADAVSEYSYILGTLEKAGKVDESIELIKKMLDIDPENVGVRIRLAETFLKAGFKEDALTEFLGAADRLTELKKTDRLEKIYLTLRHSYPDNLEVMERLCDLYRKGGSMSFAAIACILAEKYREAGRDHDARVLASEVVEKEPDNELALGILGPEWTPGDVVEAAPEATPEKAEAEAPVAEAEEAAPAEETVAPEAEEAAPATEKVEVEAEEAAPAAEEPAATDEDFEITLEGFDEGAGAEAAEEATPAEQPTEAAAEESPEEAGEPLVDIDIPGLDAEAGAGEAADVEAAAEEPAEPLVDIDIPGLDAEAAEAAEEEPVAIEEPEVAEEEEPVAIEEAGATEEVAAELEDTAEAAEEPVAEEEPVAIEEPEVTEEVAAELEDAAAAIDEIGAADAPEAAEEPVAIEEEPYEPGEVAGTEISEENLLAVEELVSPVSDEDLSDAINELMEKIEPEEHMLEKHPGAVTHEREPVAESKPVKEEYVDLSAELGMEEALEGLTKSWGEDEESSESLDEFKHAIGQQLTKEDSETHFNLGIAYMEMELYDEAAKEFKIALKDPKLEFECYIRLGLSAMAKGMPEEAKVYYLKGLKVKGHTEEERLALFYELALAYEESGESQEAGELFMEIHSKDSGFREVASKVALYAATRPSIPLKDSKIEVELL